MELGFQLLDAVMRFIERVGFPIFVAVWILIVQNKAIEKLTVAINALTTAVNSDKLLESFKKKGGD